MRNTWKIVKIVLSLQRQQRQRQQSMLSKLATGCYA